MWPLPCLLLSLAQAVFGQYGQFPLSQTYSPGGGGLYGSSGPTYSQFSNTFPYTSYYTSSYGGGGPAYAGAYYNDPFYYSNNYRPSGYNLPSYAPYYQPSGLFGLWNTRKSGHSDRYGGNNGFNWGCFPNKC